MTPEEFVSGYKRVAWLGGILGAIVLSIGLYKDCGRTKPIVTHPTQTVTSIEVPKVTEKVVKEYITDPALLTKVHDLMVENSQLKLTVQSLTSTVVTLKSSGGVGVNGGIILPATTLPKTSMTVTGGVPTDYTFSDYRLKAKFSGKPSFSYELNQKFSVLGTHSKTDTGKEYDLVSIYENTPNGLVKLDTQSLTFETIGNQPSWFLSPRIQGGLGINVTSAGDVNKVGLVGLQWLRRGIGPNETTVSFLTPALSSRGGLTLLPVSWNTGSIKHNPFTNLYVSPTIGLDKSVGVAVTATF